MKQETLRPSALLIPATINKISHKKTGFRPQADHATFNVQGEHEFLNPERGTLQEK